MDSAIVKPRIEPKTIEAAALYDKVLRHMESYCMPGMGIRDLAIMRMAHRWMLGAIIDAEAVEKEKTT